MDRLTATNRLNDGGRLLVENPQAADLDVPLTNSIIPQRGVGAVTYTRATIATVTDHEWVIRNCIAGEARFQGARRVENMTAHSKTFTNPTWTKVNLLTVTGNAIAWPAGLGMATSLIEAATTAQHGIVTSTSYANVAGNVYISSFYAKAGARSFVQLLTNWAISLEYANFDLVNGIFSQSSAGVGAMVSVGDGWYRCSIKYTSLSSTTAVVYCMIGVSLADVRYKSYVGDGVSNVYIDAHQHEDVTGQSIQTPSEYVSTNVLTTAPFHGSNVDWVKYFKTDKSGNPISPDTLKGFLCEWARTNICPYSNFAVAGWWLNYLTRVNNAWIAPDGTNSFVKIIPTVGSNSSYAYNTNITTTAQVYTLSCYVKADWLNFVQLRFGAAISNGYANFDLLNWVVGTRSLWTSSGIEPVAAFPWVYRIWAVTNTVLAATAAIAIQIVPAANSVIGAPVTWDWVSGVMAWGMQIEVWTFPSSYIPTGVSGLTRNIDFLSYNVNNVIDLKWAVYCEIGINIPWYTNISWFIIDRWANGRYIYANNSVTSLYNYDWTNILLSNIGASYNGSIVKAATSWTGSTKSIYYGNTVPKNAAYVGTFWTGNINVWYSWNGTIRNVKVWKEPPTVAELTSITSQ